MLDDKEWLGNGDQVTSHFEAVVDGETTKWDDDPETIKALLDAQIDDFTIPHFEEVKARQREIKNLIAETESRGLKTPPFFFCQSYL